MVEFGLALFSQINDSSKKYVSLKAKAQSASMVGSDSFYIKATQLDVKIKGLQMNIFKEAFAQDLSIPTQLMII